MGIVIEQENFETLPMGRCHYLYRYRYRGVVGATSSAGRGW